MAKTPFPLPQPLGAADGASPQTITGVLFSSGNTFSVGVIAGPITGVLFSSTNTWPAGEAIGGGLLEGVLFSSTNTFPVGQVNLTVIGTLFTSGNTFPAGQLNLTLIGVLFSSTNTWLVGEASSAGVNFGVVDVGIDIALDVSITVDGVSGLVAIGTPPNQTSLNPGQVTVGSSSGGGGIATLRQVHRPKRKFVSRQWLRRRI